MEGLAEQGFTGVLHTYSENDLAYYRDQMTRIVEISHDVRLDAQANPWGLGNAIGGEAATPFMTKHTELGPVFSDGPRAGAGCPSQPEFYALG